MFNIYRNVVFSFEKGSNGQDHSSSVSNQTNPLTPKKIPIPTIAQFISPLRCCSMIFEKVKIARLLTNAWILKQAYHPFLIPEELYK